MRKFLIQIGANMGKIHDRFKARRHHTSSVVNGADLLKGAYLGNCNITACQGPGAVWFNKAMGKYYCRECAEAINTPGWPLGANTPIICFDRGIYTTFPRYEHA
jgi:hypothetical protein